MNTLLKDGVLRDKAVPVPMELVPRLTDMLVAALVKLEGVGLAAPQVGIGSRIAVVEFDGQRLVLANPTISLLGRPRDRIEDTEGCLSLSGRIFLVKRAPSVTVTTRLPDGRMTITAHGWLARIIQHECDHLDGICIDQRGMEVIADATMTAETDATLAPAKEKGEAASGQGEVSDSALP